MPFGFRQPYDQQTDPGPDHHFSVDLLPEERKILLGMLENHKRPGIRVRQFLSKKLRDAPRHSGKPLPPASLDWPQAEREAAERGESVPDWMWDQRV